MPEASLTTNYDRQLTTTDENYGVWRPSPASRVFYGGGAALFALVMWAVSIASVIITVAGASAAVLAGLIFYVPMAYFASVIAVGVLRCRVAIGSESVLVAGPLKTDVIPLGDIAGFIAGRYGTGSAAVWLNRTKDAQRNRDRRQRGSRLLWATQRGIFIWNQARNVEVLQPVAAEMNDGLARARRGAASGNAALRG